MFVSLALTSLSIMFLKSICVVINGRISFVLTDEHSIIGRRTGGNYLALGEEEDPKEQK